MTGYECGTCGSDVVVISTTAGSPWQVACENGHIWYPAGSDVRIEVQIGEDRVKT